MAITINGDGLIDIGGTTSTQGRVRLAEDADNGTNYVELTAPASVASNRVITFPDATTEVVGTDTTQTLTNKTLTSPTINGGTVSSATLTSPTIGGTPVVNGSLIVLGTSQSVSGTSVDFTGIPSWVKRITVMFNGVSTTGTSPYLIQIGAGSITNTGYQSAGSSLTNGAFVGTLTSTIGFVCSTANTAAGTVQGAYRITLLNANTWVAEGVVFNTGGNNNNVMSGGVTLSGTLDRVRITTVTGADTFDAGTINIQYE